jgi:hypothetical protein
VAPTIKKQESEAEESDHQFEISLGYIVRCCLKKQNKTKRKEGGRKRRGRE